MLILLFNLGVENAMIVSLGEEAKSIKKVINLKKVALLWGDINADSFTH